MRSFAIAVTAILFFYSYANAQPKKAAVKPTKPAATAKVPAGNVEASFDKFFNMPENDAASLKIKERLGTAIATGNRDSKYAAYVLAWDLILLKKYSDALSQIEEIERAFPGWAEVYYLHGQYFNYKKEAGAIEQFQKSNELNPKLVPPVFTLATQYEEMQNYQLALLYYNFLEPLAPGHPSLYYNRALVKENLKDYPGSLADYSKALFNNPKHNRALFNRGHLYLLMKNGSAAEADFTAFIKMVPDYDLAYYYRGAAKDYQKKTAEACADMKIALNMGNTGAAAYLDAYCK